MSFWSPTLIKLNRTLANLYPIKEQSERIIANSGLDLSQIDFRNKAIDNWYVILREAKNRGKLSALINAAIKDTDNNKELVDAYNEYLNTSALFGGAAPILPAFLRKFWHWIKKRPGLVLGALGTFIVVVAAALVFYFFFLPVTVRGSISCNNSTTRKGERLRVATVSIPGTDLQAVTNDEGIFVINNVPRYKNFKTLKVSYGGDEHLVQLIKSPESDYTVPCQGESLPNPHPILPAWWKETPLEQSMLTDCQTGDGISQVKLFTLAPGGPITKTEQGDKLFVNISCVGAWKILDADLSLPAIKPEGFYQEETLHNVSDEKARQWWVQMPLDKIEVEFQVCLGAASAEPLDASALHGHYFFK